VCLVFAAGGKHILSKKYLDMNFIFSPWRALLGWYLQKIKKGDEQKEAQASIKMRCHLMHKTWEIRKFWRSRWHRMGHLQNVAILLLYLKAEIDF
jgi:hypothetical protein